MTAWNEFLRLPEFRAYRKKQAEMVAGHIHQVSRQSVRNGKVDIAALQGKMEMIRLFLKLPEDLTTDNETKAILSVQMDEDTANIAQYLIRRTMAEE